MATENKDIRLKDYNGVYLYPLSRRDSSGQIITDTYLNKTGKDSYISDAKVETTTDPNTGALIQQLTLTNQLDPDTPIIFTGGDAGVAAWGSIVGSIDNQTDLTQTINKSIKLSLQSKNRIFKQDTPPEESSELDLNMGDLWYNTGETTEQYTQGKWYSYVQYISSGKWEEITDRQVELNTADIILANDKITSEVYAREADTAEVRSAIEQTAYKIRTEVADRSKIYRQDTAPEMSSEQILYNGDLWFNTAETDTEYYKSGKWYIYTDGVWVEATDSQITTNSTAITETKDAITAEVKQRTEGEATLSSKITQTASGIKSEVGVSRTRYTTPADKPPVESSELILSNGDLWYCSDGSGGYTVNTWYKFTGSKWEPASEDDCRSVLSTVEQTASGLTVKIEANEKNIDTNTKSITSITAELGKIETKVAHSTAIFEQATAPAESETLTLFTGDLWKCTETSGSYVKDSWYICTVTETTTEGETTRNISWSLAPDNISTVYNESKITQTEKSITSTVKSTLAQQPTVFKSNEPPEDSSEHTIKFGDLWLCTETGTHEGVTYTKDCYYRFDGAKWVETTNPDVTEQISKIEQKADEISLTVAGSPTVFKSDTPPEDTSEHKITFGDLWLCTNESSEYDYKNNCYYRYDGKSWVETTNPDVSSSIATLKETAGEISAIVNSETIGNSALSVKADNIQSTVEGAETVVQSATVPTEIQKKGSTATRAPILGDIWLCTADISETYKAGCTYTYNGSEWVNTTNTGLVSSMISQSKDEITASVSKTYATINALNTTDEKAQTAADDASTALGKADDALDGVNNLKDTEIKNITSKLDITATQAALVTEAYTTESGEKAYKIAAAEIATSINDQDETSGVKIKADQINLEGVTTFLKVEDYCTKDETTGKYKTTIDGGKITADTITVNGANVTGTITVATINANKINCNGYDLGTSDESLSNAYIASLTGKDININSSGTVNLSAGGNTNYSLSGAGVKKLVKGDVSSSASWDSMMSAAMPQNYVESISYDSTNNKLVIVWYKDGVKQDDKEISLVAKFG